MKIGFRKMHGTGNDFVVVDARHRTDLDGSTLARRLLPRRFGVGGDQLLMLQSTREGDVRLRIFERDGRESETCGNGLRCVAWILAEEKGARGPILIDTIPGLRRVEVESIERISVEMGAPEFLFEREIAGFMVHAVSIGNPHAVVFVGDERETDEIGRIGPRLETDSAFPNRTNVELVWVETEQRVRARVWERGAGETWACGSGASAVGVTAIRSGRGRSPLAVAFRGGDLRVEWNSPGPVRVTGPAADVFRGEVHL